ncbi:lysylphosphatidylglycerol synthetase-like protein (DUF2156 family) [Ochrobactrum sp. 19YEA23]|uniref:hypothetical protein n=1 Tax=Ochrobactrum sp. 19YEA23 TaxID=3039854 RepID=UPI002479A8CA|nr:lysylphosphatidylglycerol synthetase-like protein (DUF2156 family) [Ochrobactrum sp. 19YEA23]
MISPAAHSAKALRSHAFIGLGIAIILIGAAPFLRAQHDLAFWLIWPVLLASTLIALGIAAHLLFDAALFRMIAAGDDEKAALAEVDSILERMGLRAKQPTLRPLSNRIAGSRRIARRLNLFLGLAIVLLSLLALLPPGAEF